MKLKRIYFISFLLLILLLSASCSIPAEKPEDGVWYCEELAISIDFSRIHDHPYQSAALHHEDGTSLSLACQFDYGNGITIYENAEDAADEEINYLIGTFEWDGDEFRVTTYDKNTTYVFVKAES